MNRRVGVHRKLCLGLGDRLLLGGSHAHGDRLCLFLRAHDPHRLCHPVHSRGQGLFGDQIHEGEKEAKHRVDRANVVWVTRLNRLQERGLEDADPLKTNLAQHAFGFALGLGVQERRLFVGVLGRTVQEMDFGQAGLGILGGLFVDVASRVDDVLLVNLFEGLGGSGLATGGGQGAEDDLGQVRGRESAWDVVVIDGFLFEQLLVLVSVVGGNGASAEGENLCEGVGGEGVADEVFADGAGSSENEARVLWDGHCCLIDEVNGWKEERSVELN